MISGIKGSTDKYLADLGRIQSGMEQAQRELSSGLRVQQPSDDPSSIGDILESQTDIDRIKQDLQNFGEVKSELDGADSALQTAVQIVDRASTLAAQATSATQGPEQRAVMAQEVGALLESLVAISRTVVSGRYIFSGDHDTQPLYELDAAQPGGVAQLAAAGAARLIQSANGVPIATAKTASEVFDAQNADGTPAAGNVFAAIGAVKHALESNDPAALATAAAAVKASADHLGLQLQFYGNAENRLTDATDLANKFLVQQQSRLSQARDADFPDAALRLSQAQVQQQAALTMQGKVSKLSLFDYLA